MTPINDHKKQPDINPNDKRYLHFIAQVIQQNNLDKFSLDQPDTKWLITDKLYQSALYWRRYYWIRIFGWISAILIVSPFVSGSLLALIASLEIAPRTSTGQSLANVTSLISWIVLIVAAIITPVIALSIGHLVTTIVSLGKGAQFDTEQMKSQDYTAIKWALRGAHKLPQNDHQWLKHMVKVGVLVTDGMGKYQFADSDFMDRLNSNDTQN